MSRIYKRTTGEVVNRERKKAMDITKDITKDIAKDITKDDCTEDIASNKNKNNVEGVQTGTQKRGRTYAISKKDPHSPPDKSCRADGNGSKLDKADHHHSAAKELEGSFNTSETDQRNQDFRRDQPRRNSANRTSTISEDGNYELQRSSSGASITSISSVASSLSAKRTSIQMESLQEEEIQIDTDGQDTKHELVSNQDNHTSSVKSTPSAHDSSPSIRKRTKHILHRQKKQCDDDLGSGSMTSSNSTTVSQTYPQCDKDNIYKQSEGILNESHHNMPKTTSTLDERISASGTSQNMTSQTASIDESALGIVHFNPMEDLEPAVWMKPPSPTIGPIKFIEDLEISVNDGEECTAKPIDAQNAFSCSSEVVLAKSSSLFQEIQESKALLEKYTCCKLFALKIPTSEFASNSRQVKGGPFVLRGYVLHAHLPIIDNSLCLAIAIQKGPEDDRLSWPFKEVVIFRIEKCDYGTSENGGNASQRITSIHKGFSSLECTGELEPCVSKPTNGDNTCVGLKFISRSNLKDFETSDGSILVYFLFLPEEAGGVTGIDLETPIKVFDDPSTPLNKNESSSQYNSDEEDCQQPRATRSPVITLPVSLEQCNRDVSIIKLYCGVTIVSVIFSGINEALNTNDSIQVLERNFEVAIRTHSDLKYSLKVLFKLANHMVSVGIALNEGPHDGHLTWPFVRNVAVQVVNENSDQSIDQGFCCSDNNSAIYRCLQQPQNGSNPAVGIRDWIISTCLLKTGFIVNNTLTVKVLILPVEFELPSCGLASII